MWDINLNQMKLRTAFYTGLSLLLIGGTQINLQGQSDRQLGGVVVDSENREGLIGALIRLSDGSGTSTNGQGRFSLVAKEGVSNLSVSYLGYESQAFELFPGSEFPDTIWLEVSATSLEEILVRASPYSYQNQFKGSNYRIGSKQISLMNPLAAEEVLRTVPGVNIVGDMGLSNRPNISIRGAWGRRSQKVLLLEDGSPVAPAPYLAPGAYYNPVSDRVQAIEVYKGADILRFGPNNQHGAVNYLTALPPQKPELRLRMNGGQRNYTTGLISYGGTWNNLGALVEGVYKRFDGFTDNASVEVLNLNAKLFAKLSDNQSLYFKVSAQFEENQASLSSITPFTFDQDPRQNPFDADVFTMRRYGVDIIHKWLISDQVRLISKVYATDFERDWWRQTTTKLRASEVRSYLGDAIFQDRYSYLDGLDPGVSDYVRVGAVRNGRESTTNSRWVFTVAGLQETLELDWELWGGEHDLELGLKLHSETYSDRFIRADSTRWARSGRTESDIAYRLLATSGYVRNEFRFGAFGMTPILRLEQVSMYRQDLLTLSLNPALSGTDAGRERNSFGVVLPGISLDYKLRNNSSFYGSVYRGFIAPSTRFGFLVERDGVVSNPLPDDAINIPAETSVNTELGWRGGLFHERLTGQVTMFRNTIDNLYLGGRNELFVELGQARVTGLEAALSAPIFQRGFHTLSTHINASVMKSTVLRGRLHDTDLFSQVVHSEATRNELIDRVNDHRGAHEVFVLNEQGEEVLYTGELLQADDFESITKVLVQFGDDAAEATLPYTPVINMSATISYSGNRLGVGVLGHYVGKQYAEFMNFENESSGGAIGALPAFFTMDAYINYDLKTSGAVRINGFVNGKNLGNQIYRASRLNRATSGIFPGGFRQLIVGLTLHWG